MKVKITKTIGYASVLLSLTMAATTFGFGYGFGAGATGGTKSYVVSNLNDSGAG